MRAINAVITGATAGIGRALALQLAEGGARLVLIGRDANRGSSVVAKIRASNRDVEVDFVEADLSSQDSVRELAVEVGSRFPALQLVIHNAGVVEPRLRKTVDGIEATFAVNHLAPFLLTQLLLPNLRAGSPARIVTVSSQVYAKACRLEDFGRTQPYEGLECYSRSKLANILFTIELARRLEGTGITANCLHPGVVPTLLLERISEAQDLKTPPPAIPPPRAGLIESSFKWVIDRVRWRLFPNGLSTAEQAADRIAYLGTSNAVEGRSGAYFVENSPQELVGVARDPELALGLWRNSLAWTKLDPRE